MNVLLCEELRHAIFEPDGPIIGYPRLPVVAHSSNRDDTRAGSVRVCSEYTIRPAILTLRAGHQPRISQAVADLPPKKMQRVWQQEPLYVQIHIAHQGPIYPPGQVSAFEGCHDVAWLFNDVELSVEVVERVERCCSHGSLLEDWTLYTCKPAF